MPKTWSAARGALVSVLVVTALGACSSPHHSTSTTAGTSTSTSSTSTTSSSSSVASTACTAGALATNVIGSQGAAGTFEVSFSLRNTSTAPCPMNGVPGTLLLDASGAVLPTTEVRAGNYSFTNFSAAPVTLNPGASAYFNVAYSDVPTGSETGCEMATQLQVTPPGASTHVVVAAPLSVCNHGTLTVSPVFAAGSPEVQTTAPPAH